MNRPLFRATVAVISAAASTDLYAQPQYMMIAHRNAVRTYDPYDGHLVHSSYINLANLPPSVSRSPYEIRNVGSELWLTDFETRRINRFSQNGNHLGDILMPGSLTPRGMEVVGDTAYVASPDGVRMFDFEGNEVGSFDTGQSSMEDIALVNGELLTSSNSAVLPSIRRFDFSGNPLGDFGTLAAWSRQVSMEPNGNVLVKADGHFGVGEGTYEFDAAGNQLNYWTIQTTGGGGNAYGVFRLGNGNIFITGETGTVIFNPVTGESQNVSGQAAKFISLVTVPAPGIGAGLLMGLAVMRRRLR